MIFSRTWAWLFCTNHGGPHDRKGKGFLFGHAGVLKSRHIPFLRPNSCQALQLTSVACIGWSVHSQDISSSYTKETVLENIRISRRNLLKTFYLGHRFLWLTAKKKKKKKKTLGLALPLLVVWPWKHLITPFWTLYHPTPACPNFIKHQTSRVGKDFK